jgi:hypothetical protein
VDVAIPKATRLNEKAVAVVIGNRDYRKRDIPGVDYAINDARTMKKYLVEALGFREENVIFEENASFADLQTIFGREGNAQGKLFNYLAADSTSDVFVFYSGHGAPDPSTSKAYLVPVDADPQLIQLTGYPMSTLYENLAKLPARSLTVMLDACFSGSSDKGMLLKGVSPALLRVETPILSAPNAVLLSASAANQVSAGTGPVRAGERRSALAAPEGARADAAVPEQCAGSCAGPRPAEQVDDRSYRTGRPSRVRLA